jgi:hypothetical protein
MTANMNFDESASTNLAALFETRAAAARAAETVQQEAGLSGQQIRMIGPDEPHFVRGLATGSDDEDIEEIQYSAFWAHTLCGASAAVMALVVVAALYAANVSFVTANLGYALGISLLFGLSLAMLAAGAVTRRPSHAHDTAADDEVAKSGLWAVLVHPASPVQCAEAMRVLNATSLEVHRTAW